MNADHVVVVNEQDEVLGLMDKLQAHEEGVLHRAFSIFIFNEKGELMLQQRAATKYHSALQWTNTCCSHPMEGETVCQAAQRRLQEEMGFHCPLTKKFEFKYHEILDNGLIEYEYDHVFVGRYNGLPTINIDEVFAWKWMHPTEIINDLSKNQEQYTAWFKIIFEKYLEKL